MKDKKASLLKQSFAILSVVGLLFFVSSDFLQAKSVEKVTGEFTYRNGEDQSPGNAKRACQDMALKEALDSVLINMKTKMRIDEKDCNRPDVMALSQGCYKKVKVLESSVNNNTVYCRIQADVDMSALEKKLVAFYRLKPNKTYKIAFYQATVQQGLPYAADDVNGAPDCSLRVLDQNGNIIFHSGQKFLEERDLLPVIANRNNFRPDFQGLSLQYNFRDSNDYLEIQLLDYDGIEAPPSNDDIIGKSYRLKIEPDQLIGKRWIKSDGWEMEIGITECEKSGNNAARQGPK